MRVFIFALAVLLGAEGDASPQGIQTRTPNPEVTAADADWQVRNDPLVVQGLEYFPTRETRIFDGQVMTQIDVYQGVPIYADTTTEPFTLVYVPLSRDRMRTYERPRDPDYATVSGRGTVLPAPAAVETSGVVALQPAPMTPPVSMPPPGIESLRRPSGTSGVWVPFNGARWYLDGAAVSYSPDRFVQIGSYQGFSVYRERANGANRIWIPSVSGGLLTPYARRR